MGRFFPHLAALFGILLSIIAAGALAPPLADLVRGNLAWLAPLTAAAGAAALKSYHDKLELLRREFALFKPATRLQPLPFQAS